MFICNSNFLLQVEYLKTISLTTKTNSKYIKDALEKLINLEFCLLI